MKLVNVLFLQFSSEKKQKFLWKFLLPSFLCFRTFSNDWRLRVEIKWNQRPFPTKSGELGRRESYIGGLPQWKKRNHAPFVLVESPIKEKSFFTSIRWNLSLKVELLQLNYLALLTFRRKLNSFDTFSLINKCYYTAKKCC